MTILKEVIESKLILSEISFTQNLGGGQGELILELNKPITTDIYDFGDIVQINQYGLKAQSEIIGENNMTWDEMEMMWNEPSFGSTWDQEIINISPTIYTGYISRIGKKQTSKSELIELSLLGMASLLSEQTISVGFDGIKKAGIFIKQLIDSFNSVYGTVFTYSDTSIQDGEIIVDGSVEGTYLDCINRIADMGGLKIFVDADRIVNAFVKPSSPTHYLVNNKSVESIDIYEDAEGIVNSVSVYNINTFPFTFGTYEDLVSIEHFGKRQRTLNMNIYGEDALTQYAQKYVIANKDSKKEAKIIVNRNYHLESLKPGDTVKIRNFAYTFDNIQIIKVSYSPTKCTLYLDKYKSYGEQLKSIANES